MKRQSIRDKGNSWIFAVKLKERERSKHVQRKVVYVYIEREKVGHV